MSPNNQNPYVQRFVRALLAKAHPQVPSEAGKAAEPQPRHPQEKSPWEKGGKILHENFAVVDILVREARKHRRDERPGSCTCQHSCNWVLGWNFMLLTCSYNLSGSMRHLSEATQRDLPAWLHRVPAADHDPHDDGVQAVKTCLHGLAGACSRT